MTGHIHADSMRLYAEDAATHEKPWELWEYQPSTWSNWGILPKHPEWRTDNKYRRKPRTININGFEVPEPMREKPKKGCIYYAVELAIRNNGVYKTQWDGYPSDDNYLYKGLCHTTKEAAEIHAKALLSFTRKNGESDE